MSRRLEQMRANPRADWKIADVEALCREFGLMCEPSRGGSSHYKVKHPPSGSVLTVTLQTPDQTSIYSATGRTRRPREGAMTQLRYAAVIEPLSEDDGGGFLATVPDLPGCMSDGETPEEAVINVQDAILSWIEAAEDLGRPVPEPSRKVA